MKSLKENLFKKSMEIMGSLSLFFSKVVLTATSASCGHQSKCPDELLK